MSRAVEKENIGRGEEYIGRQGGVDFCVSFRDEPTLADSKIKSSHSKTYYKED